MRAAVTAGCGTAAEMTEEVMAVETVGVTAVKTVGEGMAAEMALGVMAAVTAAGGERGGDGGLTAAVTTVEVRAVAVVAVEEATV